MINAEYVKRLNGKLYKVLCLFEENSETVTTNIDSLLYELNGLEYLLPKENKPLLVSLISILERMYDDSLQVEFNISVIRREVFHCMDIISKFRLEGEV